MFEGMLRWGACRGLETGIRIWHMEGSLMVVASDLYLSSVFLLESTPRPGVIEFAFTARGHVEEQYVV